MPSNAPAAKAPDFSAHVTVSFLSALVSRALGGCRCCEGTEAGQIFKLESWVIDPIADV